MSFAGYLCWKAEGVGDIVVYDAVMPSSAIFLSTHTSAPILRSEFGSTETGTRCTEQELLGHLLDTPGSLLFVPIVGKSGRGKSHLVRWLHINIPETDSRHVVYIPKYNTNLRGVIVEIMRGLHGSMADQLRADLDKAADDINESTAPEKLLYALALRVQKHPPPSLKATENADKAPSKKEMDLRAYAVQWLPELLRDHTFRSSLLAQETGVLTRFAHEAIRGRSKADRDKPFSFEEEDLPSNVSDVANAGLRIKQFYQHFIGNAALRTACVGLLNEHLGPAVAEVIGLRSGELYRILLELRRLLLDQGKELILLIEDFTVLQGVQKELLDAIIETAVRDGKRVLCSVRVAVAVTSGRFLAEFETVLTRAKFNGFMFQLDIPVEERAGGEGIRREVLDFVGAYLNACRLGKPAVEQAYEATDERRRADGHWIANACDRCEHAERCRDAFGRTTLGHGLYPFNAAALDRMIHARSGDEFDPREILGQIVHYTLGNHGADLRTGKFPSADYADHFKSDRVDAISGALVAELKRDKEPRRLPLLVFWGGNPSKPGNLPDPIHEAFQLPALRDAEQVSPPEWADRNAQSDPELLRTSQQQKPAVPTWMEAIDKWKDGTAQLDQALARKLRNTIAEAVQQRIDWNELCVPSLMLPETEFQAAGVRIEGAAGEGKSAQRVQLNLKRLPETARAFHALKWFEEHGSWKFEGGAGYLRDLSLEIDRWAAEVRAQYQTPAEDPTVKALVGQMVEHALVGSRVLGLRGSRSDKTIDLVSAVFEKAPDLKFIKPSPPTWEALAAAFAVGPAGHEPTRKKLLEQLLFLVGRSQGDTGRPAAIDVTMLIDAIDRVKRSWQLPEPDPATPDWLKSLHARVAPHVEPAVSAEIRRLDEWGRRIRAHFPDGKALNEVVRQAAIAVEQADIVAREHGVRKPGDRDKMDELTSLIRDLQLPTSGFGQVTSLWKFLDKADSASMGEKLGELATDRHRQMQQLERFVELASTFLELTGTRVTTEQTNVHAAQDQLGPTMDAIRAQLEALVQLLAPGGGAP